jgi:hypothetical protein
VWGAGIAALLGEGADMRVLREMRADQYGIRTILQYGDTAIEFAIVREARIGLHGAVDKQAYV